MDERIKAWIEKDWIYILLIGILLIGFLLNHYAASKNVDDVIDQCAEELINCGCIKTYTYNWSGGLEDANISIPTIKS